MPSYLGVGLRTRTVPLPPPDLDASTSSLLACARECRRVSGSQEGSGAAAMSDAHSPRPLTGSYLDRLLLGTDLAMASSALMGSRKEGMAGGTHAQAHRLIAPRLRPASASAVAEDTSGGVLVRLLPPATTDSATARTSSTASVAAALELVIILDQRSRFLVTTWLLSLLESLTAADISSTTTCASRSCCSVNTSEPSGIIWGSTASGLLATTRATVRLLGSRDRARGEVKSSEGGDGSGLALARPSARACLACGSGCAALAATSAATSTTSASANATSGHTGCDTTSASNCSTIWLVASCACACACACCGSGSGSSSGWSGVYMPLAHLRTNEACEPVMPDVQGAALLA
mmetsp:Transcript_30519/g.77874  ORF Transcript_30519/g.77874 Transcript_30519/m.77874 type:complete len:350 (-) Transcript_30519:9-1058(-)